MKNQLENIQLKNTIKVLMPNDILHKIKYLCRAIPKVEWSGIILYTVKGSIKDPDNMKLLLKDIIPMHKGNQTYTEYSFNEKKRDTSGYEDRMIDYFNDNPEALEEDWKIGHIHSHNSMNVFFSGTDMSELEDNAPSHNFYFSIIVNNWMDFCAKVAFIASVDTKVTSPYMALDENGDSYQVTSSDFSVKKDKMYIYDCDISSPKEDELNVDNTFENNVNEIIKKADYKPPVQQNHQFTPKNNIPVVGPGAKKPIVNPVNKKSATDFAKDFVADIPYSELETMDLFAEALTDIEIFVITLLNNGVSPDFEMSSIEIALDELALFENEIKPEDMSKSILDVYPAVFEKCFEKREGDDDFFVEVSEEVINIFEQYEENYSFLSNTIMALKYMVHKFEEYATTV